MTEKPPISPVPGESGSAGPRTEVATHQRSRFGVFLRLLDASCYFLCVVSIISGAIFLILNIWGLVSQKIVLQCLASLFFICVACLLVLGLNRFERLRHDGRPLP